MPKPQIKITTKTSGMSRKDIDISETESTDQSTHLKSHSQGNSIFSALLYPFKVFE